MRLVSWNVNCRTTRLDEQIAALAVRRPDVLALQEVTATTVALFHDQLPRIGLGHVADSFSLAPDPSCLTGPRQYGEIIASRWPLRALPPNHADLPWPERLLSAVLASPWGEIEVHTTHIPPGVTNGWTKIDTLAGIFALLNGVAPHSPRLLCGDFNTPQRELPDGRVVTWGQRVRGDGEVITPPGEERWDRGERDVLVGLAAHDLPDVFRLLHGYRVEEYSWYWRGRGRRIGRRFDHVFASRALHPVACAYLHALREAGLSDHSPIEAVFAPDNKDVVMEGSDERRSIVSSYRPPPSRDDETP